MRLFSSFTRRLRKLRRASVGELCHRAREQVILLRDWFHNMAQLRPFTHAALDQVCGRAATLFKGQTSQQVRQLQQMNLAQKYPEVVGLFSRYNGRPSATFPIFDTSIDLERPIDWHKDPKTGYRWPSRFYGAISLTNESTAADIKYPWEIGRQQFVVELARHWAVGRHACAARRAVEIMHSFLHDSPPYRGIHWASALEVAMRSIHWLHALAALSDWPEFPDDFKRECVTALVVNAEFLASHLSYYSSPYNHLIGEATALYLLAYVLAAEQRASKWAQLAATTLEKNGPRQFYADGITVEQAMAYHFFTLGFLCQAVMCARAQGYELKAVEEVVPRAFGAAVAFRQPDGTWPLLGDCDSARSVPVVADNYWDFSGLCNLAAVLWNDVRLLADASHPGPEVVWLLGPEGLKRWHELASQIQQSRSYSCALNNKQVSTFPNSGYVIVTEGDHFVLFDSGPLAAGVYSDGTPSAAHGHADMLHLVYWRGEKQLLFDTGLYTYNGEPHVLRYCRSPEAHNTLAVDGWPAAIDAGGLSWMHVKAPPRYELQDHPHAKLIRAVWTLRGSVHISRYVAILQGGPLVIVDHVRTPNGEAAHWYWQLPVATQLLHAHAPSITAFDPDSGTMFELFASEEWQSADITRPESQHPAGWRYPGYGTRQAGCRLHASLGSTKDVIVATVIRQRHEAVLISAFGDTFLAGRLENPLNVYEDLVERISIQWNEPRAAPS